MLLGSGGFRTRSPGGIGYPAPNQGGFMFVSLLVRRLKPGCSQEDFVRAWYPDKGFGIAGQGPFLARNVNDPREILAYSVLDLPDRASLDRALTHVAQQEAVRHDRIANVIESTTARGIFEQTYAFDFSSDETVARGRPQWLSSSDR